MGLFDFGSSDKNEAVAEEKHIDVEAELARLLIEGESVEKVYTLRQNYFLVLTSKRLMVLSKYNSNRTVHESLSNTKGLGMMSVPYKNIVEFGANSSKDMTFAGALWITTSLHDEDRRPKQEWKYDKNENPECDIDAYEWQRLLAAHIA